MSPDSPEGGHDAGRSAVPLDTTDRALIAGLLRDGRISIRALADRVHISRANAYTRIGRLMSEGVIRGFAPRLHPQRAGLGTSAYVMITIEQNTWRTVSRELSQIPYVEHFSLVGGDFDILALARTPDNDTLRQVVLEHIQEVPGVRSTRTWLVFDEAPGRGVEWE
ncbi:Lrp/AsnC family transcriptional regulator [Streptomyces sp. 4N509B]|uniref:Lrp/AsnC family transcriptional regulator n=1 Tax=Streptomyces sp. 4N509B TaxID=3457413 RepID=UPI003FD69600